MTNGCEAILRRASGVRRSWEMAPTMPPRQQESDERHQREGRGVLVLQALA